MQNTDTASFPIITSIGIPVTFACNLQCLGCNAGSNLGIKDHFTLEQRLGWIDNLASLFDRFGMHAGIVEILGGEPFLNRDFIRIIQHVQQRMPQSRIQIFTNGLLIDQRRNWLSDIIGSDILVTVSIHDGRREHLNAIAAGLLRLKENGISYEVKNMTDIDLSDKLGGKSKRSWVLSHLEDEDGKIHPANEKKYIRSWSVCTNKTCAQLYDNAIWKCGPTAHLRNILAKRNQLSDAEWQPYLAYEPLRLDDTELDYDSVLEFLGRGAEPVCSMCPAQNTFYAGKPVYRNEYDQFDQKKFDKKIGF